MDRSPVTVLLADPALPDASKPGGAFTADDHDQVVRLRAALAGLADYRFEYLNDHGVLLPRLRDQPPEFVLNFLDTGYRNDARRELHVAAYLELLGIPYSGSGPVALGLCFDKGFVRAIANAHGIPVPEEWFLAPADPVPDTSYPAFVKPNRGDGSLGISTRSIVHGPDEARVRIAELRAALPGVDLVIQEFLSGDEYGIGVIGNPHAAFTALPALEVDYDALDPALPRLLDYGSKTDPESPYWNHVRFRPARLGGADLALLTGHCRILFERLGLRDYARFDFRADAAGRIKLMEVNPNPAWCHDGKLAHMAKLDGLDHGALLARIITAARRREGLTG